MVGMLVVGAGIVVTTRATSREPNEEPAPPCRGAMRPRRGRARGIARPPRSILLALLAAMLVGAFFLVVDRGSAVAGDGVLWVALGIQLGALPITLLTVLSVGGLRGLRVPQPAVLLPVGVLTDLNLAGDVSLSYALTGAELAMVMRISSSSFGVRRNTRMGCPSLFWSAASGRCFALSAVISRLKTTLPP
jgi:hypothetical protein